MIELRADADCDMRTVAEVLEILADSVDPTTLQGRRTGSPQPFPNVDFTVKSLN